MKSGKYSIFILLTSLFFIFIFTMSYSEAHVLIIADGDSSNPSLLIEADNTAKALDNKGYKVLKLYQENATTKKIMKGMYKADAVIYLGHGGYMDGHYDGSGGTATPPFALVGSDDFVWGMNDKIREGFNGKVVKAPFKSNIPVILSHACFSTGWVEDKEVTNPIETIYNFSQMFTGAGANYYATGYYGSYQGKTVVDIMDEFLNGATSFGDANEKNTGGETITKSTTYNGETIWRNSHGAAVFVGDWSATFPKASQTTLYDDLAAGAWYQEVVLGTTPTVTPTVTSIDPANNAVINITNKVITITFSGIIQAGSTFNTITIKNTGGTPVTLTKMINGETLTLTPSAAYLNGNTYTITLPINSITDHVGNGLATVFTSKFTIDTTPPTITTIDPANRATNVVANKTIRMTFSENMKAGSNYWIELVNSSGNAIPFTRSISGKVLTIDPTNNLAESLYTIKIHTGAVTDLAGNPVALKTSKFSVGISPTVSKVDPTNGAINVARNKTIKVTFSENIKAGSNYWIELKSSKGTTVTIGKSISGKVLTINHSAKLAAKNKYTLILHTGSVTDLAGNPLVLKIITFTTGKT